jgi:hypothetical protein
LHEIKHDGFRMMVRRDAAGVSQFRQLNIEHFVGRKSETPTSAHARSAATVISPVLGLTVIELTSTPLARAAFTTRAMSRSLNLWTWLTIADSVRATGGKPVASVGLPAARTESAHCP